MLETDNNSNNEKKDEETNATVADTTTLKDKEGESTDSSDAHNVEASKEEEDGPAVKEDRPKETNGAAADAVTKPLDDNPKDEGHSTPAANTAKEDNEANSSKGDEQVAMDVDVDVDSPKAATAAAALEAGADVMKGGGDDDMEMEDAEENVSSNIGTTIETSKKEEEAVNILADMEAVADNIHTGTEGSKDTSSGGDTLERNKAADDGEGSSSTTPTATISSNQVTEEDVKKPQSTDAKPAPTPATTASATATASTLETAKVEASDKNSTSTADARAATAVSSEAASDSTPAEAPVADAAPPPPVLRGTLSYNVELRRHVIRGMWNYENSNLSPQRFELLRNLDKEEDPRIIPKNGEFHGSFSLAYFHTTSKGKQKERSKVITEHGVNIVFNKVDNAKDDGGMPIEEYKVDGKGTNQFGTFHINGTAHPSPHEGLGGATEYKIVLRKRYEPSAPPAAGTDAPKKKKTIVVDEGSLPPPSKMYSKGVVCLRGKVEKDPVEDLGASDIVHRISGMWSGGLDILLDDPQNEKGLCNRFEYEHKSTIPSPTFPVSGKYSGWFHLTGPDGNRSTISERDVNLRFTKNNAGYHNVEGRGSNAFGKYTISGSLTEDNILTIFRHFKAPKTKTRTPEVTSAPPPINKGGQSARRASQHAFPEPRLTIDEVEIPGGDNGVVLAPIQPPSNTSYSAVSQGVLRLNEDGSHQCTGKWAVTREHFTSGQTSSFNFRLEPHFALEAVNENKKKNGEKPEDPAPGAPPVIPQEFPLDSALYKGSFQLKKKGTRYDTVVDQQIVMKFRKSTSGAYNVYGRGVNAIGVFNLIGTLLPHGKSSGQVELYRMYPPELLVAKPIAAPVPGKVPTFSADAGKVGPLSDASMPKATLEASSSGILPGPLRAGLVRRESSRLIKLPSRLEDDDPQAQLARVMEKCVIILRSIREKDIERGAFFSEPVDPVALGIPTYRQIIKEPMDLGTVARRLEANQINTPEEFARLVRLIFENAITFNVDPSHAVHISARFLLIEFNKKFRDIERLLESLRRAHKNTSAVEPEEKGKKKKVDGKKRKRQDEPKSAKRRRLDEALAMSTANTNAMAAIVAAAPQGVPNAPVSRGEFNMMIHMIQLLQKQIVQTHNAVAELSPDDDTESASAPAVASSEAPGFDLYASLTPASGAPPEKKKSKKKAPAPAPAPVLEKIVEEPPPAFYDDTHPLTLQEQETLTETINNMPPDHIPGVIQIIRESASLAGDEDEIDLEIDQLDTVTQRKLLRHVSKVRFWRCELHVLLFFLVGYQNLMIAAVFLNGNST